MIFVRENGTASGAHCECLGGAPACRSCVSVRISIGGGKGAYVESVGLGLCKASVVRLSAWLLCVSQAV